MSSRRAQRIRHAMILGSALLFPVTMFYFSPGLVFRGARFGIVNGSLVTFGVLLLAATVFGRAFCGWLCPGAGLSEACFAANPRRARTGRADRIKWFIWAVWLAALALVVAFVGGGYRKVNLLLGTSYGVSIHRPELFLYFYIVVALITGLALGVGKRAFCHYVCWMAPFMIIGRRIGSGLRLPCLRLRAEATACVSCNACSDACPMSLSLSLRAKQGNIGHDECILCGACVAACPKGALTLRFGGADTPNSASSEVHPRS